MKTAICRHEGGVVASAFSFFWQVSFRFLQTWYSDPFFLPDGPSAISGWILGKVRFADLSCWNSDLPALLADHDHSHPPFCNRYAGPAAIGTAAMIFYEDSSASSSSIILSSHLKRNFVNWFVQNQSLPNSEQAAPNNSKLYDLIRRSCYLYVCIQRINGANRSRTLLKKSRCRSIPARKTEIQGKKVRSIVLECKFTGFVVGLGSIQYPSGLWLGAQSDQQAGPNLKLMADFCPLLCLDPFPTRCRCSILIMDPGKQTAWILTFVLGWTGIVVIFPAEMMMMTMTMTMHNGPPVSALLI